jgi:hypothetical protein
MDTGKYSYKTALESCETSLFLSFECFVDCLSGVAFSALTFSPLVFMNKKKGNVVFDWCFYGRFLSIFTITTPTMAIAIIMATVEIAKYISVGGKLTTGYGDAVGAACIMLKAVCEDDG